MTHETKPEAAPAGQHRLVGLRVQNYKRVGLVELTPEPAGITQVRGRNAQGKSSVVDALDVLLNGGRVAAKDPIRHGADWAEIEGRLEGDITIVRRFTDPADPSKTRLIVRRSDGAQYPRPQQMLEAMVKESVDPVALLRLRPQELAQRALGLVDVPLDLDQHAKALAAAVEKRRDVNRDLERRRAALATLEDRAKDAPEVPVDTAALAEELAAAERAQGERAGAEREVRTAAAARDAAISRCNAARRALEEAQEAERAAIEACNAAEQRLAAVPAADPADVRQRFSAAQDHNAAHQRRVEAQRERDHLTTAEMDASAAEQRVAALRDEREQALQQVTWPHDGLGYDAEGGTLTLFGVPFAQASKAEQVLAAASIAMAQPAKIPVLLVRDGNDLDAEHLALLDQYVRERGWQMLIEVVDDQPEGPGVWIEDGHVHGAAPAPEGEAAGVPQGVSGE